MTVLTLVKGLRQSHRGDGDPRPGRQADSVAGGDGGREKEVAAESRLRGDCWA